MTRKTIILLLVILMTAPLSAACPGCAPWWSKLASAAKTIKIKYIKTDKSIAKYYAKNILPLDAMMAAVERKVAVTTEQTMFIETQVLTRAMELSSQYRRYRVIEQTKNKE